MEYLFSLLLGSFLVVAGLRGDSNQVNMTSQLNGNSGQGTDRITIYISYIIIGILSFLVIILSGILIKKMTNGSPMGGISLEMRTTQSVASSQDNVTLHAHRNTATDDNGANEDSSTSSESSDSSSLDVYQKAQKHASFKTMPGSVDYTNLSQEGPAFLNDYINVSNHSQMGLYPDRQHHVDDYVNVEVPHDSSTDNSEEEEEEGQDCRGRSDSEDSEGSVKYATVIFK